ncbi:MAG: NADH-quinone oxidoreductase subunit N [Rubritalea sp.]|jgi:NADH-quinone oxidoreductase subunit N|tara:strand:- start:657 stop:2090 length:1434 start_codon:yes stop_codon:yes gene_type:complete
MNSYLLEFLVVAIGVIMLLWEAFASPKNKSKLALIGAGGLTIVLVILILARNCEAWTAVPDWLSRFYTTGGYSLFFKSFALISTILVLLMSYDFRSILNKYTSTDNTDSNTGEFYTLPIFACAGLMWMASATDLVSIFVSLELVTITFYVMVAYMRRNVGSLEAGVKYLILGALSTGFLVYGIAWLYGAVGTTDLAKIATMELTSSYPLLFGLSLIIISLGFKVGAVPMQLWIPDVYQGAPTPITAFLSIASKAAGFGVAIVILQPFLASDSIGGNVQLILYIMAAATLLYGNLSALAQTNFKRLLAYSSIAHAGFLLLALSVSDFQTIKFYLATYLIMTFAGFFILNLIRVQDNSDEIDGFDGLGKRNPNLALALTITMAAMAGVPLTAGFWGKLFVFKSILTEPLPWPVIVIAFVAAAAGFYYYFKVIRAIYWHKPANEKPLIIPCISKYAIIILTVAIVVIGVYPIAIECLIGG